MNNKFFRTTSITLLQAFFAAAALMTAFVSPAFAEPKVEIIGAGYGGSGCPGGTASVNVSPDGQELSILFDKFIALANNPRESRKSCNLTIPIKVPQGFQISLYDADYRGYVAPQTIGNLRAEYFFAGQRGPIFSRQFDGETNYNVRDSLATVADVWSRCGDSLNMRVNAAMAARGQGMATVDSFDLAHRGLVYHLKYRTCPSN
ncbi:DUF4360 domain-containing protein [Nostocaceae cyanobacterium CENA357]|uniref:DUF4360 domain-containing protein n=1 Tax=Atlanticothrix silvestris CENA357 TaxID=1725252 RepID=A0A8J7HK65_9CYAN|nr:DUF4360 domain-containing protein [Atlanticothrix silvestris]MBH8556348.1 DUF4360 domain-containing protein [Atlanticothrix silvestris CENA357]